MSKPSDLLSPDTIERLRHLELFSRLRVEGFLSGESRSLMLGTSTDFVSHRPYFPGDEIRHIDWRVFGRSDRLVIKRFEDWRNLSAIIALDVSNSMAFGNGGLTKHQYAVRCAALILYLMHLQRDSFSLYLFNERLRTVVPAGTGRRCLLAAFTALVTSAPADRTSFEVSLAEIEPQAPRRGLLILLSDCMDAPEKIARSLSRFRAGGTDVIVFQVVHPAERDLPYNQVSRFTCLETGSVSNVDPLEIRNAYREQFALHTRELRAELLRRGMDHWELTVDENYEKALGDYLTKRMELLS